jgi:hypothetical protein
MAVAWRWGRSWAGTPESDLLIPLSEPRRIAWFDLHEPLGRMALGVYGWRDRREARLARGRI